MYPLGEDTAAEYARETIGACEPDVAEARRWERIYLLDTAA